LKTRTFVILLSTLLIALSTAATELPRVNAIGVANVIVQTVYWGTDPSSPQTVHPGDTNVVLSVVLANVGDDIARNVNGTLYLTPPVDYTIFVNGAATNLSSVTKVAGDMQAITNGGGTYTLTYTVSVEASGQAGVYRYNLLLSYKSARELQQVNKMLEVDVPITKGELHIQSVSTPSGPIMGAKIFPDSYGNEVDVTIVNSGNGVAKDVQVDLQITQPFAPSSSGASEIFLGNVAANGGTVVAKFFIDVEPNATYGQYSLTLTQVLENHLVPIGQVPLYVSEKVIFQILNITPTIVHPGDSGDVIGVLVRNTGSITAESVRVELQVGNYWTGTLTDFLGDMTAGQNKTAIFTVDIESNEPVGTYPLGLRFDWTQDNNVYSLNHTYPITTSVQSAGSGGAIVPIAVIVVLGVAGFLFMRRRKKLAKARQSSPAK
jgi:hypothetical protein